MFVSTLLCGSKMLNRAFITSTTSGELGFRNRKSTRDDLLLTNFGGVTTSRATSGGRRKDRNTSGQRGNKFNNSYGDISVVVAENNSIVKPKC